MADTVEQVHVWDGTSWVPVVRDDCDLPINSADGTVTLDSPSANTFTVSTGGTAIEVWKKGTANPIYATPRPDSNSFKGVWYRTYAGAASGSGVASSFNVLNDVNATILNAFIANASTLSGTATLSELRGYFAEDGGGNSSTFKAFSSNVKDRRNEANPDDRCETWFVYGASDAPSYFGGDVQTSRIVGSTAPASDASIELGANLIVSTGGEDVANVSPAGVGVFRLAAYPLDTSCKGALGVRLGSVGGVTNGATITNPNDGGGWRFQMDNQVSEDGSFGFDFRNRRLGLGTFSDGPTEALHVVGNIKCENGQVQTNTITSRNAAAGDASIQLGANLTVSTGGEERVKVDENGLVGIGSPTQAGRQLKVQYRVDGNETVAVGMYSAVNVPTGQSVNTAFGHQLQQLGGGTVNTKAVGYYVSDTGLHSSAPKRYGIEIAVASADDTYAIYSGGTADSYFNGNIKTPTVSGLAANDASIKLGAELLTTNHTPTQPNSIATKQTVDDKIWVGTTAQYNALATKNPTTLYCLTD